MLTDSVLYSTPRLYDVVPSQECTKKILGSPYTVPRLTVWRPTLGYENVQVLPVSTLPVTDARLDPCYVPRGMSTNSLRFPNGISGAERSPLHSARAALNPRYSSYEWDENNKLDTNVSITTRNFCERTESEAIRILRETDETITLAERETGRRLGERISDLTFYKDEGAAMLEALIKETDLLQDKKRDLENALKDIEGLLYISHECLRQREQRTGIDLVNDTSEKALLSEVETFRACETRLRCLFGKTVEQLNNIRASQHDLERDVHSKEAAFSIDKTCHNLYTFSRGLEYHGGIEKNVMTLTTPETWAQNTDTSIQRAQNERCKSTQLRSDIENLISSCAYDCQTAWEVTNNGLSDTMHTAEAKRKTQEYLHGVQEEQFILEKYMSLIRKALDDKTNSMQVAHTRLEKRSHRRDVENCHDAVHNSVLSEVQDIHCSIQTLHNILQECEAQQQQILRTRSHLERCLEIKANTLLIDEEKCLGIRRSYPIQSMFKH